MFEYFEKVQLSSNHAFYDDLKVVKEQNFGEIFKLSQSTDDTYKSGSNIPR
jgi:hypothetical protein